MKLCKYCGAEFTPRHPKGVFCKATCRVEYNRRGGPSPRIVGPVPRPTSVSYHETKKMPKLPMAKHPTIQIPRTEEVSFPEPKITDLSKHPLNVRRATKGLLDGL